MTEQRHPDVERLLGPDRRALGLGWVPVVLGLVVIVGLVTLWPRTDLDVDSELLGLASQVYRAQVTDVVGAGCSYAPDSPCTLVVFELLEGPTPGGVATQEFEELPTTPRFEEGDRVVLNYLPESEPAFQYQYSDRERRGLLLGLSAVFALAVVGLGRLRGLAALVGLGLSVMILISFIVPAILEGTDPVLVATVGALAIAMASLYLAHGFADLTHVALLGATGALTITVILSSVMTNLASFSGLAGEESLYLTLFGGIDVAGLLLAGIVLGALGALDDVTVTQASTVWELRRANPALGVGELTAAGLRVGRDHIASTVNTLLLAYAGASIPLLLLFGLSQQSLGTIANSEVVAVEIVRTLVGSIGLVAAVPITTWLAARTVIRSSPQELTGGH
ncbi:MAG: YibE/F family protein [Acidimicrobiia bacterium]|nr:YibE/F family protein [Acidimicrobiia bacterium]